MAQLDYVVVDVFTDTALAGNPLAVVFDTVGLETERMQSIAREFNLSETTFIQRRAAEVEQREGVRVRIFTTQEELPFAGHPTLGTASVLRMFAPEYAHDGAVRLALNVGRIPVRFRPGAVPTSRAPDSLFGEMTQRDPEFGAELDPARSCPPHRPRPRRSRSLGARRRWFPPEPPSPSCRCARPPALARLKVNHDEADGVFAHAGRPLVLCSRARARPARQ